MQTGRSGAGSRGRQPRRRHQRRAVGAALVGLLLPVMMGAAAPATRAPTATGEAGFGEPVVVSEADTAEPGLDIAPEGTLYVNAPGGFPGASFLWRSGTGGETWSETPPGLRAALPGGGDSDVAIDPDDGTVYLSDLWVGSSTLATSGDGGESWVATPVSGLPVHDRQWVETTGGGVVYLVYAQAPAGIMLARSVDGGLTFPVQTLAAATLPDRSGCICPPGTLVVEAGTDPLGQADRVGVAYATSLGGVGFARSTDGGLTFTQSTVARGGQGASTLASFPVVASAGGGRLFAVWTETTPQASVVRFSRSTDFGESWRTPRTLVEAGTPAFPWVAARGSKVAVSLYHTGAEATPDTVDPDAQWFQRYLESTDGGATFGPLATVDATPVKTGPICTAGIECTADRELLDFQQVALDRDIDGRPRANVTWARVVAPAGGGSPADTQIRFARQDPVMVFVVDPPPGGGA